MWAHFFESLLQGAALFLFPFVLIAGMAGALMFVERMYGNRPEHERFD